MPKHIENIREDLITEARRQMLVGGYDSVTIRSVASSCDIAVGTVYNYFRSKDYLVACVMLDDWNTLVRKTKTEIKDKDPEEGIEMLFKMISDFSRKYGHVWSEYRLSSKKETFGEDYRKRLVDQIREMMEMLVDKPGKEKGLSDFLADLLLRFASDGYTEYKDIKPFMEKLLS